MRLVLGMFAFSLAAGCATQPSGTAPVTPAYCDSLVAAGVPGREIPIRPPRPLPDNPSPAFPSGGDVPPSGYVVAQFVIDASGRIKANTLTALESTHPAFLEAVRAVAPALRFAPGLLEHKCPVQVMAQQRFDFHR